MSGLGKVFSGTIVDGDQQPLNLRAMVDLDPFTRFELLCLPRNLARFRGQGLVVVDHLLETGSHISTKSITNDYISLTINLNP